MHAMSMAEPDEPRSHHHPFAAATRYTVHPLVNRLIVACTRPSSSVTTGPASPSHDERSFWRIADRLFQHVQSRVDAGHVHPSSFHHPPSTIYAAGGGDSIGPIGHTTT